MSLEPLVSVLINNYNYGRFLRDSIDSALQQTYQNIEVIVVDDGSTDNSREIIASYGNGIIPVLKENGGQASAFNAGFAKAKGEWIALLDSDDVWMNNKLTEVVSALRSRPEATFVYHRLQPVSTDLTIVDELKPAKLLRGNIQSKVQQSGGWWPFPSTSCLVFRRDLLTRMAFVPEREFRICADGFLCYVAPFTGPIIGLSSSLTLYRQHGGNLYHGKGDSDRSCDGIRKSMALIKSLVEQANLAFERLGLEVRLDLEDHIPYRILSTFLQPLPLSAVPQFAWRILTHPAEPSAMQRIRSTVRVLLNTRFFQKAFDA